MGQFVPGECFPETVLHLRVQSSYENHVIQPGAAMDSDNVDRGRNQCQCMFFVITVAGYMKVVIVPLSLAIKTKQVISVCRNQSGNIRGVRLNISAMGSEDGHLGSLIQDFQAEF